MRKLLLPLLSILFFTGCKKEIGTNKTQEEVAGVAAIKPISKIPSVTIGGQIWMLGNLNVSEYRNGDDIPQVKDPTAWKALTTGAWCYYENSNVYGKTYGKLYNWYAVNDPRGLAPEGWHIPSDAEWTTLTDYLGGEYEAGGKMKETGTTHWVVPNTDATNSSGFTELPSGFRDWNGIFHYIGYVGIFWSSTEYYDAHLAWSRQVNSYDGGVGRYGDYKQFCFSVRCILD